MAIVYQNRVSRFPGTNAVLDAVDAFVMEGEIIPDSVAQEIASWYHSPASPNSTRLSTMGIVTDDMRRSDFVSDSEYVGLELGQQDEIDALTAYIRSKQEGK